MRGPSGYEILMGKVVASCLVIHEGMKLRLLKFVSE